ncbi:UPF0280 family protein [Roseomonas eburnea]|uniref:UPF0280 family protein n=1 Tax=Neoroseomonas eburnea TaxID=1346889 RepID=A0A9X9XEB0_9PROT|nr:UPF0280 family protein [Neoroseomonas eburnea]
MDPPVAQRLTGGRLHLSHGPIDVVLRAWGAPEPVRAAEEAAIALFPSILPGLVAELVELRRPMSDRPRVAHPVARRMVAACAPFAAVFVTPMAAVAGAVADALLAAMWAAAPLDRAYVNDGGDIALRVRAGESLAVGLAADPARLALDAALRVAAESGIGGIATSGRHGRSFSLGIADAVTVLARDAATADVAATLIANAVDLDSPAVRRAPAVSLDPDSDLGGRLVTVGLGPLTDGQVAAALAAGLVRAEAYRAEGLILGAALRLGSDVRATGLAALPAP